MKVIEKIALFSKVYTKTPFEDEKSIIEKKRKESVILILSLVVSKTGTC